MKQGHCLRYLLTWQDSFTFESRVTYSSKLRNGNLDNAPKPQISLDLLLCLLNQYILSYINGL